MQSKTNRRGLALGAVVALLGSLFGVAPASQAVTDGAYIDIRPLSDDGGFGGLLNEDFGLYAQLKSGAANANVNFKNGTLKWKIERVSGAVDVLALASTVSSAPGTPNAIGIGDVTGADSTSVQVALSDVGVEQESDSVSRFVALPVENTTASYVTAKVSTDGTGYAPLYVRASSLSAGVSQLTSMSNTVTLKVTAFIDDRGTANDEIDAGEWFTSQTITLYATGKLAPTVSVGSPAKGDTVVTASATLNTINWSNMKGKTFFYVESEVATTIFTGSDGSNNKGASSALSGATATTRNGVVSNSFAVTSLTESKKIWGELRYDPTNATPSVSNGVLLGAASVSTVISAPAADELSISATAGANITGGGSAYTIRPNSTYTVNVMAMSGSADASVSTTVTVTLAGTGLVTSSKLLSINGGAFVTAYPADGFSVVTGTNGLGTFTFATSGFVAGDYVTISANVGNTVASGGNAVQLTVADPTYTVETPSTLVSTTPGTAVNLAFTVVDQWDVASPATNQYIKMTRGTVSGFNWASTISYHAVAAGAATVPFTGQPATATGSVTVEADIVKMVNGAYIDDGSDVDVTITVTSNALSFGTGLAASTAASVSYWPTSVSWTTITGKVVVTGSAVTVTGDSNLIFRQSAAFPATTAGTITINSNASAQYSFQVASLLDGSHTMTLTNGSASTTSLLVVSPAASDHGTSITWDTTAISAGRTKVIIGTLTDRNGNPVDTTNVGSSAGDEGTASIVVTYTGTAGIVVGTMPVETDADGQFRLSVLTSAADSGTMTITATYNPQGASTLAAAKLASVNTVTIGAGAAASDDKKVNAGSFKGYVAVYAKGYEGQRLSAKVGNDWVVVPALASNFVRVVEFTGAGYTIAVRIYIDRVLVDTITVTTK